MSIILRLKWAGHAVMFLVNKVSLVSLVHKVNLIARYFSCRDWIKYQNLGQSSLPSKKCCFQNMLESVFIFINFRPQICKVVFVSLRNVIMESTVSNLVQELKTGHISKHTSMIFYAFFHLRKSEHLIFNYSTSY